MEVAGLVLAVYPATVLAFEQYKKGAKYFSHYMRFRQRYEAFIRDMEGQQLFFEGILQDLMCDGPDPFLAGANSKDAFLKIVRDGTFVGWRDPVLKKRLLSRLDTRYDWCIHTIKRVYDILEELGKLLDIQALQSSDQTPDWWKYQWKRISQTLFVERYEEHKEAKRLIDELKQMVELSDKQRLQGLTRTITSSFTPFFQKIRENANNLHSVLKTGWNCHCNDPHKAMLRLERRVEGADNDFKLLFNLESPADESRITERSKRRGVVIRISRPGAELVPTSFQHSDSDSAIRLASRSRNGTAKAVPSLSSSSRSSVLSEGSSNSLNPVKDNNKGYLQVKATGLTSRFRKKLRSRRNSEDLQQTVSAPATNTIKQFTILENMQYQARLDEKHSIKSTNSAKFDVSTVSIESRITEKLPTAKSTTPQCNLIKDLCHAIKGPISAPSLGYLLDTCNNRHDFLAIDSSDSKPNHEAIVTLDEILKGDAMKFHRFPPERRANVATILASSLLQLQRTHWLKDNWTRRDIYFITKDSEPLFDQPYLSQDFISTKPLPDTSSATSDFRQKTALECLGILLIELCFGSPIESHQHKVQLRPLSTSSQPNHEYNLAIAHAWTWEEIWAENPLFPDPINSCLSFPNLQGRVREGKMDDVINDMYNLIAKPLYDDMVVRWPPRVGVSTGDS